MPDSRQKDQAKCLTKKSTGHWSCLKIFRSPSLKLKQTTTKILSLDNLWLTHSNSWINSSTWTFFSPLGSNYFFQDSSGLHLPENSKSFWPSAAFVASLDVWQLSGNMPVIANKATICDNRRWSQQQFVVQIFYQKIWRAACTSDYKLKPHSTKKITSHRFRNLHFNLENFKAWRQSVCDTSRPCDYGARSCCQDFQHLKRAWYKYVVRISVKTLNFVWKCFSIPLYLPNSSLHDFSQRSVHLQFTQPPSIACSCHICWWDESNVCHRHRCLRTWNSNAPLERKGEINSELPMAYE